MKNFDYNNDEKMLYTKYLANLPFCPENELGKIYKLVDCNEKANSSKKIWEYNSILKMFYPLLRKIKQLLSF
tara:strand:- start:94 stop:309 length:216 start_codon:yes stop_codon:yes gene_type:complete